MLEIKNRTPFAAAIVPGLDKEGRDTVTVVVKGTFDLGGRTSLAVSDEQVPIVHAETFHGEPGLSSIKYEADACPAKKGTDVVLVGHACSIRPVSSIDVSLAVGPVRKIVRVTGDRVWVRSLGGIAASDPVDFTRMPLIYERAFGGADHAFPDDAARPRDPRNPIGVGFTSATEPERVEGVRLPNLEDPQSRIATPADRPPVAGFGFIGRDWLPRRAFAGTYDDAWQAERFPFLPADFDERFFNGALPGLTSARPLKGGEAVHVTNVTHAGEIGFRLPAAPPSVALSIRRAVTDHVPALDTVLIESDLRRVVLTWRVTVLCPRLFLYIDHVRIGEKRAA